jgi:hypothetical protein
LSALSWLDMSVFQRKLDPLAAASTHYRSRQARHGGIVPLNVAATGAGGTVMVATRLTQVRAFCHAQWWGGDYLPSLGGRAELDEDFFGKE